MATIKAEKVLSVHHWNDTLFSFRTTRNDAFRFENGHFTMIGLENAGKRLMRAYSMVSANYEEELEFFSIKVPDGPLTSKLQHLQPGDEILVSQKATGSLILDKLLPGKHLYLIATGTGLAPFLSIIKDLDVYDRFAKIILAHGVRKTDDLAYREYITNSIFKHEYLGDIAREKLIYYPSVTREKFFNMGRLTHALESGRLSEAIGLPPVNTEDDRFMLCGSVPMLDDFTHILEQMGFSEHVRGDQGHWVVERAFVEK